MANLPNDLRMLELTTQLETIDTTATKDAQFDARDEIGRSWLESIGVTPEDWMLDFVQAEGQFSWQRERQRFDLTEAETVALATNEFLTRYLYRNPLDVFLSGDVDRFSQGIDTTVAAYHLSVWASDWSYQRYKSLAGKASDKHRGEMHNLARLWWNPTGFEVVLPIGDDAMSRKIAMDVSPGEFSDYAISEMPKHWAVTDGDVWAAFVVPVQIARTTLSAFPLVTESTNQTTEQRKYDGIGYTLTGEVHIHLVGDPLLPDVTSCIEGVRKWAKRFAGKPVGATWLTVDRIKGYVTGFHHEFGRYPRKIDASRDLLGAQTEQALDYHLRFLGVRWSDLNRG